MVLACSSHCLRLTFCFRHFFSTFWLEFCCRKVLPSSPFVCISYRLGIILGTHMLFHRLTDAIHFLKPCPSQPSFLTARSGCWWSLVHRKLFTKQGGPLYMARITVGVTAQQSLEKLGFWHREGFEDMVDRVQGLQGHTCRETDCSSDRRNWLQLRESLVVLLWETLRPICLYSPLSFFSLFLSNALSWVRNSCLQACFGVSSKNRRMLSGSLQGHTISTYLILQAPVKPLTFFLSGIYTWWKTFPVNKNKSLHTKETKLLWEAGLPSLPLGCVL